MIKMIKKRLLDNRGFTLVEMIVVMAILGVVMTATMSLIIPAKRSSVIQSDLATVQGGMRVVIERMSKDFRNAGFLINGNPISNYGDDTDVDGETLTVTPTSADPLIISTRAVSGRFGRIAAIPGSTTQSFALIYDDQFQTFPPGTYAAVVEPVNGTLLGDSGTNNTPNNIYQVMSSSSGFVKLGDVDGAELTSVEPFSGAVAGLVMLVAPSSTDPAQLKRQIKYWLENGTLKRQIDSGNVQNLAQGISGLSFELVEDGDGDVHRVTIELEGKTVELSNDAIGSAKTKRMSTTISLRNV